MLDEGALLPNNNGSMATSKAQACMIADTLVEYSKSEGETAAITECQSVYIP
jgi:hypothetical protein